MRTEYEIMSGTQNITFKSSTVSLQFVGYAMSRYLRSMNGILSIDVKIASQDNRVEKMHGLATFFISATIIVSAKLLKLS